MYRFCSICGGRLRKNKQSNLACTRCDFINYRNPRPTATVLVLYKNNLLLTKRARAPFKGWWDLPGGFIDRYETAEAAAVREIEEETGLKIKIKRLLGTYIGNCSSGSDNFRILSIVFLAQADSSRLKALDDVCDSQWFAKKDLPKKFAFDSNQKIIKDFLKVWN